MPFELPGFIKFESPTKGPIDFSSVKRKVALKMPLNHYVKWQLTIGNKLR